MVPAEDIGKMAQAVLDIQLPKLPVINHINNLLSNATTSPKNLDDHAKDAQTLVHKAQEVRSVSENMKSPLGKHLLILRRKGRRGSLTNKLTL